VAIGIRVEYCASCNYLPRTLWMVGEILTEIQAEVSEVALVPGDRGIFEWQVDGETVFSKGELGHFPELEELKEAIYSKLD